LLHLFARADIHHTKFKEYKKFDLPLFGNWL